MSRLRRLKERLISMVDRGRRLPAEVCEKDMEEDGSFPCPRCGEVLSPEDEEHIQLLEVEGECGANKLNSIVVKHTCGQVIRITYYEGEENGDKRPSFYT